MSRRGGSLRTFCRRPQVLIVLLLGFFPLRSLPDADRSGCSVSVPGYLAELGKEYEKRTGIKVLVLAAAAFATHRPAGGRTDFAAACQSRPAAGCRGFRVSHRELGRPGLHRQQGQPRRRYHPGSRSRHLRKAGSTIGRQLAVPISTSSRSSRHPGDSAASWRRCRIHPGRQGPRAAEEFHRAVFLPRDLGADRRGDARGIRQHRLRQREKTRREDVEGARSRPHRENIVSGVYPYRRPLYLVVRKSAAKEARQFVDFVIGAQGQALISSYGMPASTEVK